MKRLILILCLAVIVPVFLSSSVSAGEAKKPKAPEWKVKGELIAHPETNDVKVLTESYDTVTVLVDGKKTKINASIKSKLEDLAKEGEAKLPKGEVTFTLVDGKPVATRITYTSGQNWKMSPPKPKED